MKKYLLAATLGAMSSLALAAACPYPLDATDTQYAQAGITRFPYLPAPYQSPGYTVVSTVDQNNIGYYALSYNGVLAAGQAATTGQSTGDLSLPTSGIVAFELAIDHFPTATTTSSYQDIALGFSSGNMFSGISYPTPGNGFVFGLVFQSSGFGGQQVWPFAVSRDNGQIGSAGATKVALPQPVPAGFRTGVYFNMNTREVGYTVNGVDYGYMKNSDGTPFTIPAGVQAGLILATANVQVLDPTDATLGMPVGATLITDSAQFTQPFPNGVTDICGNSGSAVHPLLLPNGKPYPGKANPPGLQKFQSLPLGTAPLGVLLQTVK